MLIFVSCFFLLSKDTISSCFFLTTSDCHGILYLTLGLVGKHSAAASMWAVTKFSYPSFKVCLSNIPYRVLNLFLIVRVSSFLGGNKSNIEQQSGCIR